MAKTNNFDRNKQDLMTQLNELKTELASLRVAKIAGGSASKLGKMYVYRGCLSPGLGWVWVWMMGLRLLVWSTGIGESCQRDNGGTSGHSHGGVTTRSMELDIGQWARSRIEGKGNRTRRTPSRDITISVVPGAEGRQFQTRQTRQDRASPSPEI